MLTRRQLLKRSTIGGAIVLAPSGVFARTAEARVVIPRLWASACPTPGGSWPIIDARSTGAASLDLKEFTISVHPDLPATRVWGYEGGALANGTTRSTYLGPTVVAERGAPVNVTFNNLLTGGPLFPTDPALVPDGTSLTSVRINTHLHGGRIVDTEDGNPFDAYGDMATGQPEVAPNDSQVQTYANAQGGALLWYHDHALGVTRTNVYAGLAGGYLLTEPPGSSHAIGNVPTAFDSSDVPDPYGAAGAKIPLHIPLVIQDKDLDDKGQLVYPFPWAPEFFGTTCLVNGKAFPYLDVQPRRYRFTFLNGSQSRFYNLRFNKAVTITQIGVELGPLDSPVDIPNILLGPAERADVIVDFTGLKPGTKAILADTPLPVGVVSPTRPLGDCMQFRVVGPTVASDPFAGDPVLPGWKASSPTPRPAPDDNGTAWPVSRVTLEEVMGRGGKPIMAVVNGTPFMKRVNGAMTHDPDDPFSTEIVQNGSTVDWDYINLTADSHPFHTHLAHFEVVHRHTFNAVLYMQDLMAARANAPGQRLDPKDFPNPRDAKYTPGPIVQAPAQEKGPKDTVIANPGEVTRIRLTFELPNPTGIAGTEHHYVYHCHILEHEENEMMRPLLVKE